MEDVVLVEGAAWN